MIQVSTVAATPPAGPLAGTEGPQPTGQETGGQPGILAFAEALAAAAGGEDPEVGSTTCPGGQRQQGPAAEEPAAGAELELAMAPAMLVAAMIPAAPCVLPPAAAPQAAGRSGSGPAQGAPGGTQGSGEAPVQAMAAPAPAQAAAFQAPGPAAAAQAPVPTDLAQAPGQASGAQIQAGLAGSAAGPAYQAVHAGPPDQPVQPEVAAGPGPAGTGLPAWPAGLGPDGSNPAEGEASRPGPAGPMAWGQPAWPAADGQAPRPPAAPDAVYGGAAAGTGYPPPAKAAGGLGTPGPAAGPGPQAAHHHPPAEAPGAVEQVLSRARGFSAPGLHGVEVQLQPESLGRVALRVVQDHTGELRATIRAERPEVAQALRDRIADLTQGLAAQGLKLGQITVGDTSRSGSPWARADAELRPAWTGGEGLAGGHPSGGHLGAGNGRSWDGQAAGQGPRTAFGAAGLDRAGVTAGRTLSGASEMPSNPRGRRLYLVA